MVLLKDPESDRYLPLTATAPGTAQRSRVGVSAGLVRDLLDAVGAPARYVEIGEAAAGPERVVLVVGNGVRVPAAPLEAVSLALEAGLPIRCADAVLAAEGVAAEAADSLNTRRSLADPAPTSAYRLVDPDETTQMEAIHMSAADDGEAPAVQPSAGAATLQIRQGPGAGAVFVLDAEMVTCGRDGGNEIVLDGATVSRKHADFRRQEVGYTVSDLDSLNGTYVNGERVETTVLATGDEIRIGRYRLTFVAR
ncbi:FHA domain-containing protein [Micromonospora sp. CPCC 206061]|uniref:FHA domain-containing protein n=1 Tax=Micromonospora sp. CPCC 206061 TaxID=3122410 RepID=UPI002FF25409